LEGSREVGREIEHYNSLPVSQRIIQDHGGAIRVVSSLERGTEFVITLPRKARP
jgi:signal transduction histidine kinase